MNATREPEVEKEEYGLVDFSKYPTRVIKTEGFERLFSHFTGLHGDELMRYVKEFQTKALQVCLQKRCVYIGLSVRLYNEWWLRRVTTACSHGVL